MKLIGLAGLAAAILFSPAIATTASAQGLAPGVFVAAEGQWGFFFADPVLSFYVTPRGASESSPQYLAIETAVSGRVAWGGVAATSAPGVFIRLDTIVSAWRGDAELVTNDAYAVGIAYHPAGQPTWGGGAGFLCGNIVHCGESSLARSFWEIMPGTMLGFGGAVGGPAVWVGARPFYARIGERSEASLTSPLSPPAVYTRQRIGMIDAAAIGGLFAIDASIPLARRIAFTADGGIGYYRLGAAGETELYEGGEDALGATNPAVLAAKVGGYRAQLGMGLTYNVSPSTAIGLVGRADFWSAYPTLAWPDDAAGTEANTIAMNRMVHLSAGLSITIRTGGGP